MSENVLVLKPGTDHPDCQSAYWLDADATNTTVATFWTQ